MGKFSGSMRRNFSRLSFGSSSAANSPQTSALTVSTVSTALTAPGDDEPEYPPGYKITPLDIRELNELIRKRYELDIYIWGKRFSKPRDRPVIEEKMASADAALSKIIATLRAWDREALWETPEDWERLKLIRQRLDVEEGKKRYWVGNPPWPR